MHENKENYSILEAAKILRITKQCLYNLIEDGHATVLLSDENVRRITRQELLRLVRRTKDGGRLRRYITEIDRS